MYKNKSYSCGVHTGALAETPMECRNTCRNSKFVYFKLIKIHCINKFNFVKKQIQRHKHKKYYNEQFKTCISETNG